MMNALFWFFKRVSEPSSWAGFGMALNSLFMYSTGVMSLEVALGALIPSVGAFVVGEKGNK